MTNLSSQNDPAIAEMARNFMGGMGGQGGAGRVGFIPFFMGGSRGRAGGPQGGPARAPSPGVSARGGFGSTGHFSAGA